MNEYADLYIANWTESPEALLAKEMIFESFCEWSPQFDGGFLSHHYKNLRTLAIGDSCLSCTDDISTR